ncbi:MAG: class I SAM-dependent methyltransferase [Chitinophagales bacterium]
MSEGFRPISNTPPIGFMGSLKFYGRFLLDLQALTIYNHLKKVVPSFKGNVIDVGCGQSPYRFLLDKNSTQYFGIDVKEAASFDYDNKDITYFNGADIPFEDNKFDGLICTEVVEHVHHYQKLINEMHRVMKPGATGIITIPWSARFHYEPYDYFRYTPSSLKMMFAGFSKATIKPRGSDISNIANKVIVLWVRNLLPSAIWKWLFVPLWIASGPIAALVVLLAHVSLWFNLGSTDDPLGYTIILKK